VKSTCCMQALLHFGYAKIQKNKELALVTNQNPGAPVNPPATKPPEKGGILAALRRSPLVGSDLDVARSREVGRKIDI
jgi:hypothetical protein